MFRSGENLFQGALEFIEQQNSISIFSAYTMRPTLEKLNSTKKVEHIVVRWDTRDLITGIADLSITNTAGQMGLYFTEILDYISKSFWEMMMPFFMVRPMFWKRIGGREESPSIMN